MYVNVILCLYISRSPKLKLRKCLFKWLKLSWRWGSKLLLTKVNSKGSHIFSGTSRFSHSIFLYWWRIKRLDCYMRYPSQLYLYLFSWFRPPRYEGRCGLPSNFDATYCNALGYAAGVLLHSGKTGLISSVCTSICTCQWICRIGIPMFPFLISSFLYRSETWLPLWLNGL